MAGLHGPRAHEQRCINANRFIVQQTRRASHRVTQVRRGLRNRLTDKQDGAIVGGV